MSTDKWLECPDSITIHREWLNHPFIFRRNADGHWELNTAYVATDIGQQVYWSVMEIRNFSNPDEEQRRIDNFLCHWDL